MPTPTASIPTSRWAAYVAQGLVAAMLLVWPLRGKMTLKLTLMVMLAVAVAGLAWRHRDCLRLPGSLRLPFGLLGALTVWYLVQAFALADRPVFILHELWSHWFRIMLFLLVGLALGVLAAGRHAAGLAAGGLATVIFAAVGVQTAVVLGEGLWNLAQGHSWMGLTEVYAYQNRFHYSLIANLFASLVVAEGLARLTRQPALTPLPAWAFGALIPAALAATAIATSRHGWTVLAVLVALGAALWLASPTRPPSRRARWLTFASLAAAVPVFAVSLHSADARWDDLRATLPIAWDIEHHDAWRNYQGITAENWPLLPDGRGVDHSNYMRIAWIRATFDLAAEYPLGMAYQRNAFAVAVEKRYGSAEFIGAGHTHSGVADLTLAGGIPGILLWLAAYLLLMRRAWRRFRHHGDAASVWLLVLMTGLLARAFLDSTLFDYVEERAMLLTGLVSGLLLDDEGVAGRGA